MQSPHSPPGWTYQNTRGWVSQNWQPSAILEKMRIRATDKIRKVDASDEGLLLQNQGPAPYTDFRDVENTPCGGAFIHLPSIHHHSPCNLPSLLVFLAPLKIPPEKSLHRTPLPRNTAPVDVHLPGCPATGMRGLGAVTMKKHEKTPGLWQFDVQNWKNMLRFLKISEEMMNFGGAVVHLLLVPTCFGRYELWYDPTSWPHWPLDPDPPRARARTLAPGPGWTIKKVAQLPIKTNQPFDNYNGDTDGGYYIMW